MAAHIYTALNQIKDDLLLTNKILYWEGLQAALDYSCWTEELDLSEYAELQAVVKEQSLVKLAYWLGKTIPVYQQRFVKLDYPADRETWLERWFASLHVDTEHDLERLVLPDD
jgi:hypothetical protein